MYKELINYLLEIALRHKAVKTAKYQSRSLINQQNNNGYMQVIIEDDVYAQYILSSGIYTMTFNIDILDFINADNNPLEAHSDTFQVANEIISFIENDAKYKAILSVYDYSMLTLSHFTNDNAFGQRITLELQVPNPVNMCALSDNFDDEVPEEKKQILTLSSTDECTNNKTTGLKQTITLKPKKK